MSIGPGAVPLAVEAAGDFGGAARGEVVAVRVDSFCKARQRMSRRLHRITRSATVAGSVAAVTRSFLSLYDNPYLRAASLAISPHCTSAA